MAPRIPKREVTAYNQTWYGVFGEFGTGQNAKVYYLQSAMNPDELQRTTLISDINGSEAWPVRDLFQREVDADRVRRSVLPYFQDGKKVKFFNPLTLTALPIDPETKQLFSMLPELTEKTEKEEGGRQWRVLEMEGFYRYRYIVGEKHYAEFSWNDRRVQIVAIDGQHRLSALKRFYDDSDHALRKEFTGWDIPFVLAAVRKDKPNVRAARLLDVIRSIFVYVNTTAVKLSDERKILLSDEYPNMVCTQEWLDEYHRNDNRPDRDDKKLPLVLFDWRGSKAATHGAAVKSAALLSITELKSWLDEYVLGKDFINVEKGDNPPRLIQMHQLGITPKDVALHKAFQEETLLPHANEKLREKFRDTVLPGLNHLLMNFTPIRTYAAAIRAIEKDTGGEADIARHAYHKLRFEVDRVTDKAVLSQVKERYNQILIDISLAKEIHFAETDLLAHDIGMRGVMSAFRKLRLLHVKVTPKNPATWEATAKWFIKGLNPCFSEGWLDWNKGNKKDLLLHITHDRSHNVQNYRLHNVPNALGAYLAIVIAAYCRHFTGTPKEKVWEELYDEERDRLKRTLQKGYEKEQRILLKEEYNNTKEDRAALKQAVQKKASKEVNKHIKKFETYLPVFK